MGPYVEGVTTTVRTCLVASNNNKVENRLKVGLGGGTKSFDRQRYVFHLCTLTFPIDFKLDKKHFSSQMLISRKRFVSACPTYRFTHAK